MTRSDDSTKPRDVRWREAGTGMSPRWRCMGCDQLRQTIGARGTGVRRRCAQCVAGANKELARA